MDEIKLNRWKENFETEMKNIQVEYNSFFLNRELDEIYKIILNDKNGLELKIENNIPNEIKKRLKRSFLSSKPEDNI